ncbi:MAG TPA: S8 family serine peptidase, partial [Puia sp.]
MFRILTACLFLTIIGTKLYAQATQMPPAFKNGRIPVENSLISRKINHSLWQSSLYGSQYYVVIQLNQSADQHQKNQLLDRGIRLTQWISGNNWLATCRQGFDNRNLTDLGIRNIYSVPESLKLNNQLPEYVAQGQGPKDLIAVNCFSADKNLIAETLKQSGAKIIDTKIKPANVWFIQGSPKTIRKLASLPFVISIHPIHLEDVPLNYNNRAIHGVQTLSASTGRNLTGKNVVVGIGDNADPTSHIDLAGKVIMRTDEPVADHGTHTSGTIAGGGILNPMYAGMAPRARLVMNDFSNIIVNSPTYVTDYNIPLTNNSYYNGSANCPGEGEYNELSYYVDAQLLAYPKLLHVFAAGNDGSLTCSPYPASFGTVKSGFQCAKNILSVGDIDNMSYIISYASSLGPAKDGRIKPEIVAGGVYITSTYSNNNYATISGTSQASPTVAGILALITERYRQLHGNTNPDGGLLKALVANSAVDLGNPGPDFSYGFGMISARTTVEALEQNHYFTGSVNNNATQLYTIPAVPAGTKQLKILLYWPDVPGLPSSVNALVNDLDLTVTEPGGLVHLPLILDPSPANVNNNAVEGADHLNNIEQVVINNPTAGDYSLQIKGSSIPAGPQNFYVAYEMVPSAVNVEYPFGTETWVPGQQENIRWSANGGEPNTFTLEYSLDAGSNWTTIDNSIPSQSRSYAWTVPAVVSTQALIRITRNVAGFSDMSDYPFTIMNQPVLTVTNTCPGYARLKWNSVAGADAYDVMKLSADTMQVIAHITDTSWLATPLRKDSSYWFSVRAVHA